MRIVTKIEEAILFVGHHNESTATNWDILSHVLLTSTPHSHSSFINSFASFLLFKPQQSNMFCPFCAISSAIPPSSSPAVYSSPNGSAYPVLSTPNVIAFLDIAPLSPGHILLCPRRHVEKASSMTGAEAATLGFWLPVLGRAVISALGADVASASWNVIQANGQ